MRLARAILAVVFCLVIVLGAAMHPAAQAQSSIQLRIYEIDDTYYPDVQVYFSAYHAQTGRFVEDLTSNLISADLNGQGMIVGELEDISGADRAAHVVLVLDLTSSVSGNYLNEQKRAAFHMIDQLDANDRVAVVTFDDKGARVNLSLTADRGSAQTLIEELAIVQGPSNKFYDGIDVALAELGNVTNPLDRKAVVVLTDVKAPRGTATPEQVTQTAVNLGANMYFIGFGEIEGSILSRLSDPTGGFTYLERELDDSLDRLAEDLARVLTGEYRVALRSSTPASNAAANLQLTLDLGGGAAGNASLGLLLRQRTISISFPNITDLEPRSGEVTFEPIIVYADNQEPVELASVAYYIEKLTTEDELLSPPDTTDPIYTWDTEPLAGGNYNLRMDVVDVVGNQESGRVAVKIAKPLTVTIVSPMYNPALPDQVPGVEPGLVEVKVDVIADFGVNEVRLFVDGDQVGDALTEAPFNFSWDTGSSTAAGLYSLRVEASDVNNDVAFAEIPVRVTIGSSVGPVVLILTALVLLGIIVIISIVIGRIRRRQQLISSAPTVGIAGSAAYGLVAVSPASFNNHRFPLYPGRKTIIGRSKTSDIQVIGTSASRSHSEINESNGVFYYRDLNPQNPSLINGRPLAGQHLLQEGDRITVSETELVFTMNQPLA